MFFIPPTPSTVMHVIVAPQIHNECMSKPTVPGAGNGVEKTEYTARGCPDLTASYASLTGH